MRADPVNDRIRGAAARDRKDVRGDPRLRKWVVLAGALVVVGSVGSLLSARLIAQGESRSSHQAFVASSTEIATNLELAIVHEQDLVTVAGAYAARTPTITQSGFRTWADSVGAFARYPELRGIAQVTMVRADQLGPFAARMIADPTGPLGPTGTFQVTPPGDRPYYCLESAVLARPGDPVTPPGTDLCASGLGTALLQSRDSGRSAYLPLVSGGSKGLILGTPVYGGGDRPTTTLARRAAFIGWTGTEIDPGMILSAALVDHPDTALAFTYRSPDSHVTFTSGAVPSDPQSASVDLHNGWTLRALGAPDAGGLLASPGPRGVLIAGVAGSLLLGLLIIMLSGSRIRAMHLVHTRTDELHHQAFHDPLTGLPNRALVLDRIDQMMARAHRDHVAVAGLSIDVDHLKQINDSLGHEIGDQILVRVAARLSKALREGDTAGRLGGDEFIVLAEGASLAAGPAVVADRILDIMATPFELPGSPSPLAVSVSIGIATGYRALAEDLLRDANIALYQAKAMGGERAIEFSSFMQDAAHAKRLLDRDLRTAVAEHQFFLMYQPTVNMVTGEFTGAEALLRWRHPVRGIVRPGEFIPDLEASGLIVPVGRWILEEACRQGAAWRDSGRPLAVSVNIAALQLEDDRIVSDVQRALADSGFDAGLLVLEVTESMLMHDVTATIGRLHRLKAMGVRIAIDDFGTGYSSLAYLRQFPIDILKIDQSFVSGLSDQSESAAIVHTLVQLGQLLGLETTAEGIETTEQHLRLVAEGVDNGQGYLFAKPLEVEVLARLLNIRGRQRQVDLARNAS